MKKIVTLLGDFYHPESWIEASFEQALAVIKESEEVEWIEARPDELIALLKEQPEAVVLFKEDRLNPQDEIIHTWMNEEVQQAIAEYVEKGGGFLSWHAGLASYDPDGAYVQMLKGWFEYHPVPHPIVTYTSRTSESPFGPVSFAIKDEHYFVKVNEAETNVFLESDSEEGHSLAGWYHTFGEGRVCCLTPAHNQQELLDENLIDLLAKTLQWVAS